MKLTAGRAAHLQTHVKGNLSENTSKTLLSADSRERLTQTGTDLIHLRLISFMSKSDSQES